MKTPISYYGGQQRSLKHILPLIPEHDLYNEPFAGGAELLFAKEPAKINVINDINGELMNFYRMVPSNEIREIFTAPEGNEWILTASGIVAIDRDNQTKRITGNGSADRYISGFHVSHEFWCGLPGGRVRRFDMTSGRFHEITLPVRSAIIGGCELNNGKAILLTENEGFLVYDSSSGESELYDRRHYPVMPSDRMVWARRDSFGEAWIETGEQGILHFDPQRKEVRYFLPEVDQAGIYRYSAWSEIIEDVNGYTWVYPKGGGFSFYDREKRELRPFYNRPGDPKSRFSNVVFRAYSDRQGNLWMNTYSRGIEKVSFAHSPMHYFRPAVSPNASAENEVRALAQSGDGTIWCAARDGSLHLYDTEYRYLGRLGKNGRLNSLPAFNSFVYTISEDRSGNIWLGTRNEGVFRLDLLQSGGYHITNYRHNPANALSVSTDNIYAIYEDPTGRIWFGSWGGGLNYFDPDQPEAFFVNYRNNLPGYPVSLFGNIRCVTGDSEGVIWVGTTTGMVSLSPSGNEYRVNTYPYQSRTTSAPNANDIHDILVMGDTLWIATFGGGLNRMIRDTESGEAHFTTFNTDNGFPADIILNIEQDEKGLLWMSSENEIIRFDPLTETAEIFSTYTPDHTGDINFSEGASLRDRQGNLVFGHSGGAYRFDPATIRKSSFVPRIMFNEFLLFNREVNPQQKNSPLERHIDNTQSIQLKYNQSVFSLEFAALDYHDSETIEYAYMLDGFDREWNYIGTQHTATYTNLPYGRYTLRVRSTNADQVWVDNTRSLEIEMLPPFWRTGWAYLFYVLAGIMLLYLGFRLFFSFYRLRNEIQVEHRVTEMKLRFFTDISHEIRTPLTLISTPVEHLLESGNFNESERGTLKLVKLNTDRLLRLVNQLLDFRKIQNRKMKMHIEPVELASFASSVCYSFVGEADERHIRFTFNDYSDGARVWADKDKLEKILFNLLSNAFKFTRDGRAISCSVTNDIAEMAITVKDEGSGIAPTILENLFVRFESTDRVWHTGTGGGSRPGPVISKSGISGTGIGLSLVKELVDLHLGQIDVETSPETGTKIRIRLLKGYSHFTGLDGYTLLESVDEKPDSDNSPTSSEQKIPKDIPGSFIDRGNVDKSSPMGWGEDAGYDYTVLFIEDNKELRHFLVQIAGTHYRVLEADNGETGLKIAQAEQPDLIVSDIMMEGMDGLEMMGRLRADISTSHIPVILLTARGGLDDRLQAMELGADDYIIKPFSSTYLLARISNLLEQRVKLQEFYAASIGISARPEKGQAPLHMQPSSADSGFMEKLRKYMEENLADPDLRIEGLLAHFCVSRSLLFKKIKSLTGLSPVEYIREFRVQRATELIRDPDLNIKEITYRVGMNDARYFARCFKQKHGISPTEYRAKMQSTENQ